MDILRTMAAESTADPRLADIANMAERLDGTLRTCEALLTGGRAVDVAGLDIAAGRLCAAVLDLPPDDGARLSPVLEALLARLDGVHRAFLGHEAET